MKIERSMNLDILAEHIGPKATREDAAAMRDALIEAGFSGQYLASVDSDVWQEMVADNCGETC